MALYVIGDTHFSESSDKPMDVFGGVWKDSRKKLIEGFSGTLRQGDKLVLCGDFSWGMTLEETLKDFQLLDSFPGEKLLLKGNHDYWWQTVGKMKSFFDKNQIKSLHFLHNNCIFYNDIALCGTRGWFFDKTNPEGEDEKIFQRELIRLEKSLSEAKKARPEAEIYCFLHYPPIFSGLELKAFTNLLIQYGVTRCFYGHLHGTGLKGAFSGFSNGIEYRVVSADAVGFRPVMISE